MSNYKFKTTNIRGKQYVEVNERIKFFRQEEQYKNWGINTEFPMLTAEECLCRATITDNDGMVVAVGHAHENRAASNINKTSYVENCETSAVGRALAMLGIGIDTSIASANEVETAIEQQDEKPAAAKKKAPAKKAPAKKAAPKKEEAPVEDIMDKAVNYVKGSKDKRKAYDLIESKYGDQLSENQLSGLFKFVR
jgi:hypothetical protein|tara:strand:- start:5430 stop:6014 length:585 start_codon:yes stop_codon:yes gene_type:complete